MRAEQLQAFICEGLSSPCAVQGGYGGDVAPKIRQLLKQQKLAVGFGGSGGMDSPVGWVGTESGLPGGKEIWSTGGTDGTAKDSEVWMPKACDTPLQMGVSPTRPPCPMSVFPRARALSRNPS